MIKQIRTNLICSWCFTEAPNRVIYIGDFIARIDCENCGHIFKVSRATLNSYLLYDWEMRSFTKPVRLAKEMRNDPSHFLVGLPFRIMSKPLRMAKELIDSYDS